MWQIQALVPDEDSHGERIEVLEEHSDYVTADQRYVAILKETRQELRLVHVKVIHSWSPYDAGREWEVT